RPELASGRTPALGRADGSGRALRAGGPGVSVAEPRRSPPARGEPAPAASVLVVAARGLGGGGGEGGLSRRVDDKGPATVVLALEAAETVRALEILRGLPRVEGVLLLAADP